MSTWASLFIPLVKGLDLSRDATLGSDELHAAHNVDFTVDGQVRGRPSRAAATDFVVRDPADSDMVNYLAGVNFDAAGFTPSGLLRLRDVNGERPALATNGRLFTKESTDWLDRGPFACTKVDRITNYVTGLTTPSAERVAMTSDFGRARTMGSSKPAWALLAPSGAREREQEGTALSYGQAGNGARCGTTTAVVTRGGDAHIYFTYRTNGASSVTTVDLTGAATAWSPSDIGDAPCICSSHDATSFWVGFRTSTTDVFKVMNVSITGTVNATYTSPAETGLVGLWIDNTPVAGNRVMVGFTHADGLTLRTLNATTMADLAVDSDYALSAGVDGDWVVVGCQSSTKCWWAYKSKAGGGVLGDVAIGVCTVGTAASATLVKTYFGGPSTHSAYITWGACHQPVLVDGRMYLTLVAASGGQTTGTWLTIDLSSLYSSSAGTGPFNCATLVARGPSQATYPHLQPGGAIVLSDGTGFEFPTQDWTRFQLSTTGDATVLHSRVDQVTTGLSAMAGLNRVTFSGPRAVSAGPTTVFSGSVPHMVSGGDCTELGFHFLSGIPGFTAVDDSGGSLPAGDYGVQACWRWTDAAGQIHRGAPTTIETVTLSTTGSILAVASNPQLSEKAYDVVIELYVTTIDPTTGAPHFLQGTYPVTTSAAVTFMDFDGPIVSTSEPIYVDGSVLGNYPVRGDGGVCTVGRRMWMADDHTVYASKYLTPGTAPEFNDFGSLLVNVPAGAGRIVSLESLDDKVVVFCERGVFFIQDGGPDNTGTGADFMAPVRISDLRIAGPRASCVTDGGVLFCTQLDETDASRGGPWLIDRQLTFTERQYLGRQALPFFLRTSSWVPEVAYSPEKQQAYITTPAATATSHGVVVIDMRVGKWSSWDLNSVSYGDLRSIAVVNGVLWALNDEPAPYSGTPGTDSVAGDYAMSVSTAHLASNGQDGAGWGRVRSARALGGESSGAHTLTISAVQDGTRSSNSGAVSIAAATADTTWPASRQLPEWRLPSQKCSTLQLTLSATPATARWSAIRLDVAPLPSAAPAKQRY